MLPRVENAAAREIEHPPIGRGLGCALAAVKGLCGRKVDARPATLAGADREIHVLVIDEEALVETAERRKHAAADKEKRPHDLIDRAGVVMGPFGDEVRR